MAIQDNNHNTILDLLKLAGQLKNFTLKSLQHSITRTEGGKKYLTRGLGSRSAQLSYILSCFLQQLPPDREKPLSVAEFQNLEVMINIFYIHVFGLLDNAAWFLAYESGIIPDNCEEEDYKFEIGLFKKATQNKLRKYLNSEKLFQKTNKLEEWFSELGNKRHPSAHRIPLYVTPLFLKKGELPKYHEYLNAYMRSVAEGNFETTSEQKEYLLTLGKSSFHFAHEADYSHPVYPTILDDCRNSLSIAEEVINFIVSTSEFF